MIFNWFRGTPKTPVVDPSVIFSFAYDELVVRASGWLGPADQWTDDLNAWPTRELARLLTIRQLAESEDVVTRDGAIHIPYSALRALSDEDVATLRIAEPYPHTMRLEERGTLDLPTFTYRLRQLDNLRRDVPGLRRQGCFIEEGTHRWLLSQDKYQFMEVLSETAPTSGVEDRLERYAVVRACALKAGVELSPYLASEEVVAPTSLEVQLFTEPDGSLTVQLLPDGLTDSMEIGSLVDASPALPRVITLDRPGLRRIRLVARPPVHEALEQLRPLRRMREPLKSAFLDQPERHLASPAVDLEQFSKQVNEAGIRRYRASTEICDSAVALKLESECGDDEKLLSMHVWELTELCERARARLQEGGLSLEHRGHVLRLEGSLIEDLEKSIEVSSASSKRLGPPSNPASIGDTPSLSPDTTITPRQKAPGEHDVRASQRSDTGATGAREDSSLSQGRDSNDDLSGRQAECVADPKTFDSPTSAVELPTVGGVPCEPAVLPFSLSHHVCPLIHQLHGIAWLQTLVRNKLARGALLADDMGLGKTLQVLAFIEWYRQVHPADGPVLLVVPVGLLDTWEGEYEKFFRGSGHLERHQIYRLHGPGLDRLRRDRRLDAKILSEYPVVLTTYSTVRTHFVEMGIVGWSVIVADEAQNVKSPTAQTTLALKHLSARFRVAVTGTPVENGLVDLWSLMDFAVRGQLGSQKSFVEQHTPGSEADYTSLAARIASKASPCLLRRRKVDYLEGLPSRHQHFIPLAMSEAQRTEYANAVAQYRSAATKGGILDLLIRLRQVCCAPTGLEPSTSVEDAVALSCKIGWLIEKLRCIRDSGEKALVFVEYRDLQRTIVSVLQRTFSITVGMINGDVQATSGGGTDSPRKRILREFALTEGFAVLVLSPVAAGTGLTIVEANHVIHFTRHWNPAREDQATDRVYRIGQTRPVHVYYPIAVGAGFRSIDERLHDLLEGKRRLQESALFPVASQEVDLEKLSGVLEISEDPFAPVSWSDVERMDVATFRRFVCALYARMGWKMRRTAPTRSPGLDATGARNDESILLRCFAIGEAAKLEDVQHGTTLVGLPDRHGLDSNFEVVTLQELHRLLDTVGTSWSELLAYLPEEEATSVALGHVAPEQKTPHFPSSPTTQEPRDTGRKSRAVKKAAELSTSALERRLDALASIPPHHRTAGVPEQRTRRSERPELALTQDGKQLCLLIPARKFSGDVDYVEFEGQQFPARSLRRPLAVPVQAKVTAYECLVAEGPGHKRPFPEWACEGLSHGTIFKHPPVGCGRRTTNLLVPGRSYRLVVSDSHRAVLGPLLDRGLASKVSALDSAQGAFEILELTIPPGRDSRCEEILSLFGLRIRPPHLKVSVTGQCPHRFLAQPDGKQTPVFDANKSLQIDVQADSSTSADEAYLLVAGPGEKHLLPLGEGTSWRVKISGGPVGAWTIEARSKRRDIGAALQCFQLEHLPEFPHQPSPLWTVKLKSLELSPSQTSAPLDFEEQAAHLEVRLPPLWPVTVLIKSAGRALAPRRLRADQDGNLDVYALRGSLRNYGRLHSVARVDFCAGDLGTITLLHERSFDGDAVIRRLRALHTRTMLPRLPFLGPEEKLTQWVLPILQSVGLEAGSDDYTTGSLLLALPKFREALPESSPIAWLHVRHLLHGDQLEAAVGEVSDRARALDLQASIVTDGDTWTILRLSGRMRLPPAIHSLGQALEDGDTNALMNFVRDLAVIQ